MTCIVGYVENGVIYMGADSAGVGDHDLIIRKDKKVFVKGDFIFGFTSSFRMGQLLRYKLEIPANNDKDDYGYMCSDFIDAVIKCFSANGYVWKENEKIKGGQFLVGYNGNIYNIQSDFQVGQNIYPYDSCGCGEAYALGAMASMGLLVLDPRIRLMKALEIAEQFSAGVRGPFFVESLDANCQAK